MLPLFVFYDDFQANPALSPHPHKVGATYISVPCIPPPCQSVIKHIFLSVLFETDARAEFGNQKTFAPLVKDLSILEKKGILVNTGTRLVRVYFLLGLLTGDNLGLHCLCGVVEGFSANFPCRFCKADKKNVRVMITEDETVLRTQKSFEEDLAVGNVTLTGVKEYCVFNSIPSFEVSEKIFVDPMHDLLEGIAHYDMLVILRHFVNDVKFYSW